MDDGLVDMKATGHLWERRNMNITILRFEWKIQDLWLGMFWKTTMCQTDDGDKPFATDIWICLVPCVPLHITVTYPPSIKHSVAAPIPPEGETK